MQQLQAPRCRVEVQIGQFAATFPATWLAKEYNVEGYQPYHMLSHPQSVPSSPAQDSSAALLADHDPMHLLDPSHRG